MKGVLEGSELQTNLECGSELEGHLGKVITVKMGASGRRLLTPQRKGIPQGTGHLDKVRYASVEKTSKPKRAV